MYKNIVPKNLRHWLITIWHKFKYQIIIGKSCYISHSIFENNCAVGDGCQITSSFIGKYTYVTEGARISNLKIGRFCSIGPNFRVGMASHPLKKFVSTSPIFYLKVNNLKKSYVKKDKFTSHKFTDKFNRYFVEIGNDVWIGSNVTIMDGVKIGDGAVIGANSLVTKSVPPYSISKGVPSKCIKFRFSKSKVKNLLSFKWWNKTDKWIFSNINFYDDIDRFLSLRKKRKL